MFGSSRRQSHVIDDQSQIRVVTRDPADLVWCVRRKDHDRHARIGGRRPEPVCCSIRNPRRLLMVECDAYSKHALLVFPGSKGLSRLRAFDREPAHDRKTVRISGGCFQGVVVVVARPGRRHHDGTIDASRFHHGQELQKSEGIGQMRPLTTARNPRPFRSLGRPEMDLRVNNHRVFSSGASSRVAYQATPAAAATSIAASRNGAPGTCIPVPMNSAKAWVNTTGPNKLAMPKRLAFAPCSWPCSLGPTRRLINPIEAEFAKPQSASKGILSQNATSVGASPNA